MNSIGRIRVPGLYTVHAPGVGRLRGLVGSRLDMRQAIADRKADGVGYPRERVSPVTLGLWWSNQENGLRATDINANGTVLEVQR